ncbi:5-formyltetrahydrofolate cyclo-ligase [uncultured Sphingomonas sp.]|uniref:5-formyltetrahydrofolate cyclo-ligase n=1 Tax=uncultured Sphingomonas sp. TaxID=158754 RepID=UPI002615C8AE|nr:5-formyltetrahydrofolate cyclo-ligase [uncultured Sphingomonas sp.]
MTDKRALRARMRAIRDAHDRGGPLPLPAAFLAMLRGAGTIAGYMPVGAEADPAPFMHAARAAGLALALPHVIDRPTPLRFLGWDGTAPLATGPFGLLQPPADAPAAVPDIILTPLVAFDARGNRLGQGAGHYDRAFAQFPTARRIGIAWSVQQVEALVPDPWDVPLHAIATELDWIVP